MAPNGDCKEIPSTFPKLPFRTYTPQNAHGGVAPGRRPSYKTNLPTPVFQVLCWFQGGYRNLPGIYVGAVKVKGGCSWEESRFGWGTPLAFGKSIHVFDLFIVIFHDFSLYIMVNHHDITMKSAILCKTLLSKMFSKSMELKMMVCSRNLFFQGAPIFRWTMLTFRRANRISRYSNFLDGWSTFSCNGIAADHIERNIDYNFMICSWLWAETNPWKSKTIKIIVPNLGWLKFPTKTIVFGENLFF